jgi:hypothetical protein
MVGEPFLELRQELGQGLLGRRFAGYAELRLLVLGIMPDVRAHDLES